MAEMLSEIRSRDQPDATCGKRKKVDEVAETLLYPIGSMVLLYMVTFTINIPPLC